MEVQGGSGRFREDWCSLCIHNGKFYCRTIFIDLLIDYFFFSLSVKIIY